MKEEKIRIKYNMRFEELYRYSVLVLEKVKEQKEIFLSYGIDDASILAFEEKINEINNIKTDEEFKIEKDILIAEKNILKEELLILTASILTRLKNFYGQKSIEYKNYTSYLKKNMKDNELKTHAEHICRTAQESNDDLSVKGITNKVLKDYEKLITQFSDALHNIDNAEYNRKAATKDRTAKSNELYDRLREICACGKDYWASRDHTQYTFFLIYKHHKSKKRKTNMNDEL